MQIPICDICESKMADTSIPVDIDGKVIGIDGGGKDGVLGVAVDGQAGINICDTCLRKIFEKWKKDGAIADP